jgi:hypothetical protein
MMVAGLENFRQTRYMVSPGAIMATNGLPQTPSTRGGLKTAMNEVVGNGSNGNNGTNGNNAILIDNQTASRLADSIDQLLKWNPSISIETYERKREQYQKTTNSGLK